VPVYWLPARVSHRVLMLSVLSYASIAGLAGQFFLGGLTA